MTQRKRRRNVSGRASPSLQMGRWSTAELQWRCGREEKTGAGVEVHMGRSREAFGVECAVLAKALEVAARLGTTP